MFLLINLSWKRCIITNKAIILQQENIIYLLIEFNDFIKLNRWSFFIYYKKFLINLRTLFKMLMNRINQ